MRKKREKRTEKTKSPDYFLFSLVSVLVIWGIFTVGAVSFPLSLEKQGTPWYFLLHQLLSLGIGLIAAFIVFKLPLKTLKKWAPHFFVANLILLFFVFLPKIGVSSGGATRWISLAGHSFQPSELLKVTFLLYLASWLSSQSRTRADSKKIKKREQKTWKTLLPFGIILVVLMTVLILQPDMTTLGIICLLAFALYLLSKAPWWHIVVLLGMLGSAFTIFILTTPYRLNRLFIFMNPEAEPLGRGYQLRQAAIALGSGKTFGLGLALSHQKFGFLPEAMTDSIFAVIGEELGFIGAVFLILLFLLLLWRGLRLGQQAKDNFQKLLAYGISIWLTGQALLNIGGITGIIPMGGIPLPFFSYGGSHLIAELIGVGLLLNISKNI